MKTNRKKKAIAIVEAELEHHRQEYRDAGINSDPVKDARVQPEDDHVLFIFDGAGNDYFSYHSPLTEPRKRLFAALEEEGFLVEDRNNWSITIWEY